MLKSLVTIAKINHKKTLRRRVLACTLALSAAFGIFLLLNLGGLRARILARIRRVENWPVMVPPPQNFKPQVPQGFTVSIFAKDFVGPRWLAVSPNGDVFVADSAAGKVIVLRGLSTQRSAEARAVFADHLNLPFGIAFHQEFVYVAETDQVVRFRYDLKSSKRLGPAESVIDLPGFGYNQHWTRSLAFSRDGEKLFVSVGSKANVDIESDPRRAAILVMDPTGSNMRVYASGLRNAVGIACEPDSDDLWATVNERDDLGDDVPSDYFAQVVDHGFYGWPYAYGNRQRDNRVRARPDLVSSMSTPDILLGAHVAPLQFAFYDKQEFPAEYWHGVFIAEHGSWNRRIRSGYEVVFVPFQNGSPVGSPRTFFSGFVPDPARKEVYGRMVGIAVAEDGALLISDDAGKVIWRVAYAGERALNTRNKN